MSPLLGLAARLADARTVPCQTWDGFFDGEAEGHAYYCACEAVPPRGFRLSAVIVEIGGVIVALCPVFELEYQLSTALQGRALKVARWIEPLLPWLLRLQVIGLGSPLAERCHIGFASTLNPAARKQAVGAMIRALQAAAAAQGIGLLGVKDLAEPDYLAHGGALTELGFGHVNSLPVAVLDLAADEPSYFKQLSPNMRKDLRRKLAATRNVRIERDASILGMEAEIEALYVQTCSNSELDYGAFEQLPEGYFSRIVKALGTKASLTLYYVNGTLAAFNLLLMEDQRMIDKYWGMSAELGREQNLYFLSWMENLRYCLQRKIPILQTGQTAYRLKMRLGSRLIGSPIFFRHRNWVVQRILQRVAKYIAFDKADPDLQSPVCKCNK